MSYDNTGASRRQHLAACRLRREDPAGGDAPTPCRRSRANWLMMSRRLQALRARPPAWRPARPARSSAPSSTPWWCSRTSATAAAIACRPAPSAWSRSTHDDGKAHKCTLCYDRLKGGLEPACAKSCPTDSIQFGEVEELHERAGGAGRRRCTSRARRRRLSLWRPGHAGRDAAASTTSTPSSC